MFLKKINTKKENENKIVELGYVYLIRMNIDYKIGISKQPQKRLVEFTKLPYPIEKICVEKVLDYKKVEKDLHEKFSAKRKRGEWFLLSKKDVDYIKKYLKKLNKKAKKFERE